MKRIKYAIFLLAVLAVGSFNASAQETESKVVDEVIAQVNDGVVTLSRINREMNEQINSFVKEGKMSREQATAEVEAKRGELIANIINEELLLQKSQDIGLDAGIDAEINRRFTEIMKQENIKSLDVLYKEMEKGGINPTDIREVWRRQLVRDAVFQREVNSKIYTSLNSKEIKAYYEANKAKFIKPETITISELFLSFAGADQAAVREKAKQLVAKARVPGADFGEIVAGNSDNEGAKTNKGKVNEMSVKELGEKFPEFAKALTGIAVGGVPDPIEVSEGIEILRVDARTKASNESVFDETEVRSALAFERLPEERKKYMSRLRSESYIKINDAYRPLVSPILFADDRTTEAKKSDK